MVDGIGYPVFVKPVRAGSSFGITKVKDKSALMDAVRFAFRYDREVIIEETIPGNEVGCAVKGNGALTIGRADEIEIFGDIFDFEEKYTLKTAKIHMPRPRRRAGRGAHKGRRGEDLPRPGLPRHGARGHVLHARRARRIQRGEHNPRLHAAQPFPRT